MMRLMPVSSYILLWDTFFLRVGEAVEYLLPTYLHIHIPQQQFLVVFPHQVAHPIVVSVIIQEFFLSTEMSMEVSQVKDKVTTLWSLFPSGSPTSMPVTIPSSLEKTRSRKFGVSCNLCIVGMCVEHIPSTLQEC